MTAMTSYVATSVVTYHNFPRAQVTVTPVLVCVRCAPASLSFCLPVCCAPAMASAAEPVPEAPLRRMIIQKIVQENFKSYAGVVEIGPFHKVGAPPRRLRRVRAPLTLALPPSFPRAVVHVGGRPERERQEQRHRLDAVRVWVSRHQDAAGQAVRADSPLGALPGRAVVLRRRPLCRHSRPGRLCGTEWARGRRRKGLMTCGWHSRATHTRLYPTPRYAAPPGRPGVLHGAG
jgi:hypothetical protein